MTIDLIITTYKPDTNFLEMVETMTTQSVPVNKVIIYNREEKYFDRLLFTTKFLDDHKNLEVHHLSSREFDCGKSRNAAVRLSEADFVVFMDQGVMPVGKEILADLHRAFVNDSKVAVSYARLIPADSRGAGEKYVFKHFWPEEASVRSASDFDTMGWKTCLSTNNCAMYKREVFDKLGGFLNHVICNEDMLYAAKALKEGYKVAYVPSATVILTDPPEEVDEAQVFFDKAVSFAKHPEIFDIDEIRAEGRRLYKEACAQAKKSGSREARRFKASMKRRLKGFKKGRNYKSIGRNSISKYSANKVYWRADDLLRARSAVDSRQGYGRSSEEMDMLHNIPVKAHKWEDDTEK